jgi:hypothetical protein
VKTSNLSLTDMLTSFSQRNDWHGATNAHRVRTSDYQSTASAVDQTDLAGSQEQAVRSVEANYTYTTGHTKSRFISNPPRGYYSSCMCCHKTRHQLSRSLYFPNVRLNMQFPLQVKPNPPSLKIYQYLPFTFASYVDISSLVNVGTVTGIQSLHTGTEIGLWNRVIVTRVEEGANTSTVTLWVVRGDKKESLKSETLKYGLQSQGTRTRERLRWQGPAAHIKDRLDLSSERAPHKNKTVTVTQVIQIWS